MRVHLRRDADTTDTADEDDKPDEDPEEESEQELDAEDVKPVIKRPASAKKRKLRAALRSANTLCFPVFESVCLCLRICVYM